MPRPRSEDLSRDPKHIRKRIRNRVVPLTEDIEMLANARKPLAEWDLEELARGRPRGPKGFIGRPPVWLSPAIRTEAGRRLKVEAYSLLSGHVEDAIKVLCDLMLNSVDDRIRADAAKFIIEHVIGKAKQQLDVEVGEGVKGMLARALVTRNKQTGELVDAHPVIDLTDADWSDEEDAR
jgi:hypothetical protein